MPHAISDSANLSRHRKQCSICLHPSCAEIDEEFLGWASPTEIAKRFNLERVSLYRHANAFGLLEKRRKNVRVALERLIERADYAEVTGSTVVQAIQTLARLNAQGQLIERREYIDLNVLFDKMSRAELEVYAKDGTLPVWFSQTIGVTGEQGSVEESLA